jgi:hypothetical protein
MANRLWGIPQRWTCVEGLISCSCYEDHREDDGCEVCRGLVSYVNREATGLWYVWAYGCGWRDVGPFLCRKSAQEYETITRAPWASEDDHRRLLGHLPAGYRRGLSIKMYEGRPYRLQYDQQTLGLVWLPVIEREAA